MSDITGEKTLEEYRAELREAEADRQRRIDSNEYVPRSLENLITNLKRRIEIGEEMENKNAPENP
jgi:hypothetical protein